MAWQEFHFLRPWWLLAIPLLVLVWLGYRQLRIRQSGWQGVIAPHLYQKMVDVGRSGQGTSLHFVLLTGWILASLALAGPTWQRLPQPVYQVKAGQVVVMDMSLSMRATDISPATPGYYTYCFTSSGQIGLP